MARNTFQVQLASAEHRLEADRFERDGPSRTGQLQARIDGREYHLDYRVIDPHRVLMLRDGVSTLVHLAGDPARRHLSADGCHATIEPVRRRHGGLAGGPASPEVTPPMPAVVVEVLVSPGDRVKRGQPVVVVSAMKMETTLVAPHDGAVGHVRVTAGDQVRPGDVLVTVEPAACREKSDG